MRIDPFASLYYSLGISLIHLVLVITSLIVKKVNYDKLKEADKEYLSSADFVAKLEDFSIKVMRTKEIDREKLEFCNNWGEDIDSTITKYTIAHICCVYVLI